MLSRRTRTVGRRGVAAALMVTVMVTLSSCSTFRHGGQEPRVGAVAVTEVAGWTRAATSLHYLVIVNVLPAEPMFTEAEVARQHPTEGEVVVRGPAGQVGPDVRHVEAHIYSRSTGLPMFKVVPVIRLTNLTTGEITLVDPTLMQDIQIGEMDRHFGNNVLVTENSDLSIRVSVDREEVTVDGHLD